MNQGTLYSYFHRMLDRFMTQCGVPKKDKAQIKKELIIGLKTVIGEPSISALSHYDRWLFIQKAEVLLIREYGYFPDDNEELKFD